MTEFGKTLHAIATPIPGLTVWELPVHGDNRGWFKENWQREKMVAAGMPDFGPVQNNISFNECSGHHARYPRRALGQVRLGGDTDGFSARGSTCVYRPNAWDCVHRSNSIHRVRSLCPAELATHFRRSSRIPSTPTSSTITTHLTPSYPSVNPADETLAIDWPIPLEQAELSAKDRAQAGLAQLVPVPPRKTLVLGAGGQLGHALREAYADAPHVEFAERADLDLASGDLGSVRPWRGYDTIINAAAYTLSTRPRLRKGVLRRGPPTSPVSPRWRASRPTTASPLCTFPVTMCSTAPQRGLTARATPWPRSAYTDRRRLPVIRSWPPCRVTTSCARRG